MENGAPNIDAMTADEAMQFWAGGQCNPVKKARAMFPDRPKGYVTAFHDLRHYAGNISAAKACRLRGDVQTALAYEDICDSIYNRLPEFARW